MPLGQGYATQDCAIARALEVVGDRWTLLVLRDGFLGVHRFADFVARLDIPRAVLSDRLSRLVDAGLVVRDDDGYRVTEAAWPLWPALRALAAFGEEAQRDRGGSVRRFAHAGCPAVAPGGHDPGRDTTTTPAGRGPAAGPWPDTDRDGRCPACGTVPPPPDLVVRAVGGAGGPARTDPVSLALRSPHRLLTPLP